MKNFFFSEIFDKIITKAYEEGARTKTETKFQIKLKGHQNQLRENETESKADTSRFLQTTNKHNKIKNIFIPPSSMFKSKL